MNKKIELANVEISEYCLLDIFTCDKSYYNKPMQKGFTGLYFKDNNNFFAIYPTETGPKVFYENKQYLINRNLNISLQKNGKNRKFIIKDYNIEVDYIESPYIDFDVWSEEIDVDLFFMIEQSYKKDEFYAKFTYK